MMNFIEQSRTERARRVRAGKIFFVKAACLHYRHCQRVAHHQRIYGAGGGGEVHRAGFALNGDIKRGLGRQCQR